MNSNWLIIFLGLGAILLELIVGIEAGFDLVLIGIALIAGGAVGNITGSWILGITTTIILLILYIVFGRQFVKNKLKTEITHSNTESLIGRTGTVTKAITPSRAGQIKVNNEVWRAVSKSAVSVGAQVTIQKVTGVTAHVIQ